MEIDEWLYTEDVLIDERLYTEDELLNCPSVLDGTLTAEKELYKRQEAGVFIRDVSHLLCLRPIAINTACYFMHRFFMHHSMKTHKKFDISMACVFLASKVEDLPKSLDEVLKVCYKALWKKELKNRTQQYTEESEKLQRNEMLLLQILDFEYKVKQPHLYIVKITEFLKSDRKFSKMAYLMASYSFYLTPFCILYKPVVVASMCIYLSMKWTRMELPDSIDCRPFWKYMNPKIEEETLKELTEKFEAILQKYPKNIAHMKSLLYMDNNKQKPGAYSRSNSSSRHSSSYKTTQHNKNGLTINQRLQQMAHSSNNTNHIMNGTMSTSSNAAMASYPVAATTSSSSTTSFERLTFDNKVPDDLFDEQS